MDEEPADTSKDVEPKPRITPTDCKICGAPALYKYFGVTSCHACKIFFKRNAQRGLHAVKCDINGNCQINVGNRHTCTFCRLSKCFASGMQSELIRCSRKSNTTSRTKKSITIKEENQLYSPQLSNELDPNNPWELNIDERDLLSKLNRCYEEYHILSHVQQFVQEQSSLPIKLRYKVASFDALFGSVFNGIKLLFQLHSEFFSSRLDDYSSPILRCAMENAGNFTVALVLREIPLSHNSDSTEPILMNLTKYLPNEITNDVIFIQLAIAMFVFSNANCTGYSAIGSDYFAHVKDMLRIQELYAELTWKYLLCKYNHAQAVFLFIHFIKAFLIIDSVITEIHHSELHQRLMETLVAKINQEIVINK